MLSILLVARELVKPGVHIDPKSGTYVTVTRDAHQDIENEIRRYGRIERQRTSGFLPRLHTPPEGIDRGTVLADPASHPSTIAEQLRQREEFQTLLPRVQSCDQLVVVRDGYSDLRGAIVMYAYMHHKPILALQLRHRNIEPPYEPLYDFPLITNIRFEDFSEARPRIKEYFENRGLPMAG